MTKIYCSNCGTLVEGNSNFCRTCGAPQHGVEASVYRAQAPVIEQGTVPAAPAPVQLEYISRRNLGFGGFMGFFLSFVAKTFVLLALFVAGIVLAPQYFILGTAAYLLLVAVSAMLVYSNFYYEIDEDGLTIESGVIHKSQVTVPFDQVQNVNIERSIIERILGVSSISIETAGSSGGGTGKSRLRAEAHLPGIDFELAKKIHDLLIDGAEAAGK